MSTLTLTVIYSIPLILFFLIAWITQTKLYNTIDQHSEMETSVPAESVAQTVLKENAVSVRIEKSEDYTQNNYDSENGKILLSPNTIGQKDITSIGFAVHAANEAIEAKKRPSYVQRRRKLVIVETISFWVAFSILAMGLMSGSLQTVLAGYATALFPAAIHFCNTKYDLQRSRKLCEVLRSLNIFNEKEIYSLRNVLRAIVLKY
ncbi:MAG: zinc metallopeptidase [Planctomycetia bacterium]|nr:zinc metallopeptidase [Planctomycetia bacterium]